MPVSQNWYCHTVVYLAEVPPDFRPQRPWHLPTKIVSAELFERNLPFDEACAYAKTHNKRQLARLIAGGEIESWAIVGPSVRRDWHNDSSHIAADMVKAAGRWSKSGKGVSL